jgi:hypothetical protein
MALAAAALVAAAACTPVAAPSPSVALPDPAPPGAGPLPVTIDAGQAWLEEHTFACSSRPVELGRAVRCVADYRATDDAYYGVVDLLAGDGDLLTLIEATVVLAGNGDRGFASLEGFYGDTVLGILGGPNPPAVDRWLHEHMNGSGRAELEDLVLEMDVGQTRSTLRVWQRR